jgi:hypothetical protein
VDAAFLLLSGALPDQNKHAEFETQLKFHNLVHEKLIRFYEGFKSDAHPMAIMVRVCGRQCSAWVEVERPGCRWHVTPAFFLLPPLRPSHFGCVSCVKKASWVDAELQAGG